jgi:small subunit ribosomal protein S6
VVLRNYELMMVVTPQLDEEGIAATLERVGRYVSERGGSVVQQRRWGNVRRLAYPIRDYKEGTYVLTHLELDAQEVGELEASIKVSEDILRHLMLRIDEIPEPIEERPQAVPAAEEPSTPEGEPVASAEEPVAAVEDEPVASAEEPVAAVESEPVAQTATEEPPAAVEAEPVAAATEEPVATTENEPTDSDTSGESKDQKE